jgi:hypothetical protein
LFIHKNTPPVVLNKKYLILNAWVIINEFLFIINYQQPGYHYSAAPEATKQLKIFAGGVGGAVFLKIAPPGRRR